MFGFNRFFGVEANKTPFRPVFFFTSKVNMSIARIALIDKVAEMIV